MNKYYDKDREFTLTLEELALLSIHLNKLLVPITVIDQYIRDNHPDSDWVNNLEEVDAYWMDTLRCITRDDYNNLSSKLYSEVLSTPEVELDFKKEYKLSITTLFPRSSSPARGVLHESGTTFNVVATIDDGGKTLVHLEPQGSTDSKDDILVSLQSLNLLFN